MADVKEKPTVADVSRDMLDEADGDVPEAIELLTEKLLGQPALFESMLPIWVKGYASDQIRAEIKRRRERISRIASGASFGDHLQAAMTNEFNRLMDMPIFGGSKRLGDCTPDEVMASADAYLTQANSMTKMANWQFAVVTAARRNSDNANEKISAILSEKTLNALWETTHGE